MFFNVVCFKNVQGSRLKKFEIKLKDILTDETGHFCARREQSIISAESLNDYECIDCQPGAIGSFIEILQDKNQILSICDLKAYGDPVSGRGSIFFNFLFNLSDCQTFFSFHFSDFQVIDNSKYSSFHNNWEIRETNNLKTLKPFIQTSTSTIFLRIDFNDKMFVNGLFLMGAAGYIHKISKFIKNYKFFFQFFFKTGEII